MGLISTSKITWVWCVQGRVGSLLLASVVALQSLLVLGSTRIGARDSRDWLAAYCVLGSRLVVQRAGLAKIGRDDGCE